MNCPARKKLKLHLASSLHPEESARIAAHAASCDSCGRQLRNLAEEREARARALPEAVALPAPAAEVAVAPAANPWKAVAVLAMATALLLGIGLAANSRRAADALEATRNNVRAQVRFHLERLELEKAIAAIAAFPADPASTLAADDARFEVAAKCVAATAAPLLDQIELAGKDLATAERVAQARLAAYEKLLAEQVLQNGQVPAPFELAPYRTEKRGLPPPAEMSRIVARLIAANAERRDLASRRGAPVQESRFMGMAEIVRYALGETPYAAVRPATDAERVAFGDLLYRERQFDRALEVWKPVAGDPRVQRRIAELAALRRLAPDSLHLWDYQAEALLGRDPALNAEVAGQVEERFRRSRPMAHIPNFRKGIPRDEPAEPSDEPAIFNPEATEDSAPSTEDLSAGDPEELFLLLDHQQFRLEPQTDRPYLSRAAVTLRLRSAYGGPIRARLYRVPDLETYTTLTDANLVERRSRLVFVKEWEATFAPLSKNGALANFDLEVPPSGGGLFVVIADARYCPVLAVAKFVATDTALVQQVAADRVLLFAVDRATGAPQAGLALAGEVAGRYELRPEDLLPSDDANADEFKRGFEAGWAAQAAEPDPGPSWQRGFQRAREFHAARPDVRLAFHGTTDKDGILEWSVAEPWRAGYAYRVTTNTAGGENYSRVESAYSVDGRSRTIKDLVYSDRPVYRPGDRVNFKAMLRILDNEGVQPWDGPEALFEFGISSRILFTRSYPVSEFGTADGAFDLPGDLPGGEYWVRVNNGAPHPTFRVEEYRKPDFQVILNHPATVNAGAPVTIGIAVRTWSGDPVPRAAIELTVSQAPLLGRNPLAGGGEWSGAEARSPRWKDVETRKVVADAFGCCSVRLATETGVPEQYAICVVAQDASRRVAAARSRFEASAPAAVGVAVETDRPVYFPGEKAILRVSAPGAAAIRVEERKEMAKRFSVTVELRDGKANVEVVIPETDNQLCVGVRNGDEWAWTPVPMKIAARPSEGALSIRSDKSVYRLGETAKVTIGAADRDQYVLVEVGTGRIHQRQVVHVVDGALELPIEVTDNLVPNAALVAIAVRGDELRKATAALVVPPADRFLTVEVETDRREYRPGEECKATIRVVDFRGRPVGDCEISLGVVDEAVYALHEDLTPDLGEFFHRYERKLAYGESFFFREASGAFFLWKAPIFVKGLKNVYAAMGIGGGGGGGGRYGGRFGGRENLSESGCGMLARGPVRTDFRDSAAWIAALRTDAQGLATAKFAFPDSLTSFRFTARGITRDAKVGSVRQRAIVRKPFYVRIAAPRVVQEGDTLALATLVTNTTAEPQAVHVSFAGSFPVLRSTASESMTVAPGAIEKIEYLVSIDHYLPSAAFEFKAWSDSGLTDGVTIAVPGHRHGAPFDDGRAGTIAAGAPTEEVFRVPDGAIPESLALNLTIDAGLAAALSEGLEPLIDYPYGCIEQTMSRFFPAAVAARVLGRTPHRWSAKLPAVIAAGLQRVYAFQHEDGSWGWFGRDQANDGMTAYVVYGLSVAKKAGVGVDRPAVERGGQFLRTHLELLHERTPLVRAPLPGDLDLRIYMLLAISELESAWGSPTSATRIVAGRLASFDGRSSTIDDAMLALACRRLGLKEEAERLADRAARAPLTDVATAAFVLQMEAERGRDVGAALRFLLSRRQGPGWRTTIESAYAILGLSSLLERGIPAETVTPGRVTVEVDGRSTVIELPSVFDPTFDGRIAVTPAAEGWRGKLVARISFEGKGAAFYTARLSGMIGGEDRPAVNHGLEIAREYFEEEQNGWRRITDGQVHAGKPVLVRLRVTSPEAREFLMITDSRPGGCEPANGAPTLKGRVRVRERLSDAVDLSADWPARLDEFRRTARGDAARESAWAKALLNEIVAERRFSAEGDEEAVDLPEAVDATVEHRDDRTIFFAAKLPRGESNFYYVLRPELAGGVHALPATATPMYEPEIFASGVEDRLNVIDERVVAAPARALDCAPGVAGLAAVIERLGVVDADAVIALVEGNPRIGTLLLAVVDEPALRAWLSFEGKDGARADLATRMLAAVALETPKPEWRGAIEDALRAPARVVAHTLGDGELQWIREDRAFRLALLRAVQKLKGTARLDGPLPQGVTMAQILAGADAPTGDALISWKLSQRLKGEAIAFADLLEICRNDLDLPVKMISTFDAYGTTEPHGQTVAELLDRLLADSERYWKVRDGALWIGTLEELMR